MIRTIEPSPEIAQYWGEVFLYDPLPISSGYILMWTTTTANQIALPFSQVVMTLLQVTTATLNPCHFPAETGWTMTLPTEFTVDPVPSHREPGTCSSMNMACAWQSSAMSVGQSSQSPRPSTVATVGQREYNNTFHVGCGHLALLILN